MPPPPSRIAIFHHRVKQALGLDRCHFAASGAAMSLACASASTAAVGLVVRADAVGHVAESNEGNNLGLIPGMFLLSLPLGFLILWETWKKGGRIHWARLVALLAILVLLFVGGTIVSLRSGGGYDLHNYDAFILVLFLVGLFMGLDAVRLEPGQPLKEARWLEQPLGVTVKPSAGRARPTAQALSVSGDLR